MIFVYGLYRFARCVVGCRNDFCNACEQDALAELWRSFNVGHFFWIPLLPLGWHERWLCSRCGSNPRARYTTGRGYYIAGLIVFGLIAVMSWFMPSDSADAGPTWGIRVVFALATAGMVYALRKKRHDDPLHTERRRAVTPLSRERCRYCNAVLPQDSGPMVTCPICHSRMYFE